MARRADFLERLVLLDPLLAYHHATRHSPASVQASRFALDWPNQPMPFKVYTSLEPIPLPLTFSASTAPALDAIAGTVAQTEGDLDLQMLARLCYFANGITRVLERHGQKIPFRAAACTGALYHIELYVVCTDLAALGGDSRGETSEPCACSAAATFGAC